MSDTDSTKPAGGFSPEDTKTRKTVRLHPAQGSPNLLGQDKIADPLGARDTDTSNLEILDDTQTRRTVKIKPLAPPSVSPVKIPLDAEGTNTRRTVVLRPQPGAAGSGEDTRTRKTVVLKPQGAEPAAPAAAPAVDVSDETVAVSKPKLAPKPPVQITPAPAPAPAPAAAPAPTPAAAYEDQPITRIRKVIAENMHSSLATMAQLTLNRTFDATAIVELRKRMKASEGYGLEKVTINDFILLAVARTLPEFPDINANFLDGKTMRRFSHAQLGCAVDTPRGLFVPVMHDADKMSLRDISKWVKAKAAACKDGAITPAELAGGSFTVSNLGAQGVESFTPIINPPQTAILGVCGLTLRPRETADGEVEFYQAMGLSLTFDHRVVDGAPAAKFLKTLAERLENIEFLMAM